MRSCRGSYPTDGDFASEEKMNEEAKRRCAWANGSALMRAYHDEEWGVPVHADRRLFEFLVLEGAQAGLSWSTVLHKRARYREVFEGFEPGRVARFDTRRCERLLGDPGIIRHRGKIEAAVTNARCVLEVQSAFGSFERYIWGFVDHRPRRNRWRHAGEVPAVSPESAAMSRELKRRGFRFVGPTVCYAFMQAVGMVNDHIVDCFRYAESSAQARCPSDGH